MLNVVLNEQNTQEKFGSAPEDCDQKEMYKLLVSSVDRGLVRLLIISSLIVCCILSPCRNLTSLMQRLWNYTSSTSATSPCQSLSSSNVASAAFSSLGWWKNSKFKLR